MNRIRLPSPRVHTVRTNVISQEKNQAQFLANAIKNDAVTHDNAKTVLQEITKVLEKLNLSMCNVLPLMFNLNQKPYDLENHFFLEPMFSTRIARDAVICTGRQIGKSMTIASSTVALSQLIPHMRILIVTPLFEQVRRLSQNYIKPFIQESPIRGIMMNAQCTDSVLQRDFVNRSIIYCSYAFTSVTRCRGISTYALFYDELGDFDPEYPPIINMCAASAPRHLRFIRRFGTPKTLDNTMEQYWSRSSKAEWCIRCNHCGHWNVPTLDADLDAMIGPRIPKWTPCRQTPGIICNGKSRATGKMCGKPLDPRMGMWVHAHPEKRWDSVGYHVPQIILPQHCEDSSNWRLLLDYREGKDNMTIDKFYNEICGISYDGSARLITLTDIKKACFLPTDVNKITEAVEFVKEKKRMGIYTNVVMGIDWGGGGEDEVSFTTICIACLRHDGKIDIPFGYRSLTPHDHEKETALIMNLRKLFEVQMIVHDGNRDGGAKETLLKHAGVPREALCPMWYVRLGHSSIIKFIPAKRKSNERAGYRLDKARSLLWLLTYMKTGWVRFFKYDGDGDGGGKLSLMDDFLTLVEDKHSHNFAADVYTIIRSTKTNQPDDFSACCNYAVHFLYGHCRRHYPKVDYLTNSRVEELKGELIDQIEGREDEGEEDHEPDLPC